MTDKRILAVAIGGSLLAGAALGLTLLGPNLAGAQTGTTNSPPAATSSAPAASGSTGYGSNEDPTHEAGESAQREAEEDSGKAFYGHHGSNEDPAHEAGESPAREAEEDAGIAASGGTTSSNGSTLQ